MKKFIPILIVFIILSSGCLGNSVKFKECKLDYSKIKENQMTHLWIDIENTGEIAKEVHVLFLYPDTVTIESRGKKTTGFILGCRIKEMIKRFFKLATLQST